MDAKELTRFADKYLHAREAAIESHFERGTSGLEIEWNVVDSRFRPLHHVGSGPDAVSFVVALRSRFIPPALRPRHEMEVFHWMSEWTTQPFYNPIGTVYEGRLLEGFHLNALSAAGLSYGDRLYAWPGNLLCPVEVNYDSIPGEWELTKRRYLERCVDLFGNALATAGMHTNVSLPEPLLSLDFLHQPAASRANGSLVAYRNEQYIRGARVMRAFAGLFIATSASSPLRAERGAGTARARVGGHQTSGSPSPDRAGPPVIRVTDHDTNRLSMFPNPADLDVANLYRSHADYVQISNDLVQRRIRFGNNNWTPTRARSDREYVDRIIHVTSDQLHEVYRRGLYRAGETTTVEQLAQRIEIANLLARVEIPMARVELRVDEPGHDLDLDIANLILRELLLIRTYADPGFGASFTYAAEDVARARRNEAAAAKDGLRSTIEDPFSGRTAPMREFLRWTLVQIEELAGALDWREWLPPLREMAEGAPNTAEKLRARLRRDLGKARVVPLELMQQLVIEREQQVARDVARVIERVADAGDEAPKLRDTLHRVREAAAADPSAPVRFDAPARIPASVGVKDKTTEIVELAQHLIRIPSVTNCPNERVDEVVRAGRTIAGYLRDAGLEVRLFDQAKYPAVWASFPGQLTAPVMLSGHFDVVEPQPDDGQFDPVIEGDYLWGRGSADMKTVVATYMIWMRDVARRTGPYPPINLLLVGNEENGESEPTGTPHVLAELQRELNYAPKLMIVGERTGEKGDELAGEICVENRGVVRLEFVAHGAQEHTGVGARLEDLGAKITHVRQAVTSIVENHLTLSASDGWKSDYRFPFFHVGTAGVYNITAGEARLGLEIRPIPRDNLDGLLSELRRLAKSEELELAVQTAEPGVVCHADNPYLAKLKDAVRDTFGCDPVIGRKKPGTSGRFAPEGQAVIWGQTGIGPHSPTERHFIPSIEGYYDALTCYAERLRDTP